MPDGDDYDLLLSGDFGELFDGGCLSGVETDKRTSDNRTS